MTICPIAIAVGCARCPALKVCPLKETLGDFKSPAATETRAKSQPSAVNKKK